jgi:hypothetical protein
VTIGGGALLNFKEVEEKEKEDAMAFLEIEAALPPAPVGRIRRSTRST